MRRSKHNDQSNLAELEALLQEHPQANEALLALDRSLSHYPARLIGERMRELRSSLNSNEGLQARRNNPKLQAIYDLMYQRMLPPA